MPGGSSTLEILPGIGLDRARFGESRSTNRERLGDYEAFERVPGAGVTDMYADGPVMLSYDESDHLDFIEIGGDTAVSLHGIRVTGRALRVVLEELSQAGLQAEFDGDSSYVISTIGVQLYTSDPHDLNEPVEGVSFSPIDQD